MITEHHANRRIDKLRRDAVFFLIDDPELRVPTTLPQIAEFHAVGRNFSRVLASRCNQPHRDRCTEPINHKDIANFVHRRHVRRRALILRVDIVNVAVGRLGNVRVRRYWTLKHGVFLPPLETDFFSFLLACR